VIVAEVAEDTVTTIFRNMLYGKEFCVAVPAVKLDPKDVVTEDAEAFAENS
jgi:hypothetical protein